MIPSIELFFGYENYVEIKPNAIKGITKAKDFKMQMEKLKELIE